MGKIIIQSETTLDPISLIGREAGVCWGGDIIDKQKNYKRGIGCLESGHGRTWEYPQVYMVIDGYSARVIRELYTHIGGSPTRLQASTRYIDYQKGFPFVTPPTVLQNSEANKIYGKVMENIFEAMKSLEKLGVPRENVAMLLPLGMESKVVLRTNFRNLTDMSAQRLCSRAYWEFRRIMKDIMQALKEYSTEWEYLVDNYFKAKCDIAGFCTEKKCCGRKPTREEFFKIRSSENGKQTS
ncbi:MAG: FAD-dependent thymidylate synthase [Ruminococcus sp.]|nr:FAD-dependent thymidylate synthase [Ruminococcus sp.]